MGRIFNDCEKEFFDAIIEEQIYAGGEMIRFYSLLTTHTEGADSVDLTLDPLYDEPESNAVTGNELFRFKGPYELPSIVKKGDREVSGDERGFRIDVTSGMALFARVSFEKAEAPIPKEGDVVEWEGYFYDVLQVSKEGLMADTYTFMKYKCELKISKQFAPERRADSIDLVAP